MSSPSPVCVEDKNKMIYTLLQNDKMNCPTEGGNDIQQGGAIQYKEKLHKIINTMIRSSYKDYNIKNKKKRNV